MKKTICLIFMLSFLLSMTCVAYAADKEIGDIIERNDYDKYEVIDENSVKIVFIGYDDLMEAMQKGSMFGDYTLPEKIPEFNVTALGGHSLSIFTSKLTIPDSITSVDFNPSNHFIQEYFVRPTNSGLATIDGVLFGKTDKRLISYPPEKRGTVYEVPDGITTIGKYAFEENEEIEEIVIPESVTTIDSYAFYNCSNLKKIIIADNVTVIGDHAFDGCKNLSDVTLPEGLTTIGEYAFNKCVQLKNVTLPESIREIDDFAFKMCNSLSTINIPDGLSNVGLNPFASCRYLESIDISDNNSALVVVDDVIFTKDMTHLVYSMSKDLKYEVPEGVQVIDNYAFYHSLLTDIVLPESLLIIGERAFSYCEDLESISLPENISSIGAVAFERCANINDLYLPTSLTFVADNLFDEDGKLYPNGFSFIVELDSYGEKYAKSNGIPYVYLNNDNTDWLN